MRRFIRGNAPAFLTGRWQAWGASYKDNRERNPGFSFQWPTYEGQRINTLLEPFLKLQTDAHCSFCDSFPIKSLEGSIEHFKPKSIPEFYELVCQWENLYYCCANCLHSKRDQYSKDLLQPDAVNFSFEAYFIYSYNSHEISPNPILSDEEKKIAKDTIEIFKLNDPGHTKARQMSLERYEGKKNLGQDIEVNDFPYRFTIFE